MLFIAYPAEPTRCSAATLFIQNITEKEIILFTSKLKPSHSKGVQIYLIFYKDIYHCCTRISHKRAAYLESQVQFKFNF